MAVEYKLPPKLVCTYFLQEQITSPTDWVISHGSELSIDWMGNILQL